MKTAVSDAIEPHEMRYLGDGKGARTSLFGAHLGVLSLWYLEYGTPVEIVSPGAASCFCVQIPLSGTVDVGCGPERIVAGRTLGAVPAPSRPLRMRWSGPCPHLIIRVDREPVEGVLRSYLGIADETPVVTDLGLDLSGPGGSRWWSILELLLAEIEAGDGGGSPAPLRHTREAALQDLVISSLLLSHPNSRWEALAARQRPAASPYVRRAIEYIRDNLVEPLTTASVAAASGVGIRALQAGFAREIGCTPTIYIREQRLERVRAELLAAGSDAEVNVTTLALEGGFSHLGRFAHFYRQRFGELPSDTLRGTRFPT